MAEEIPVFLCLGSNSENAPLMLQKALNEIAKLPDLEILARSAIYRTEPQDFSLQPWFHNQVVKMGVFNWRPRPLMSKLLQIEKELGRERTGPRYGPRSIDMDMLLFGEEKSDDPVCLLPHPALCKRAFALWPLSQLAPDLPINGKTPAQWLNGLNWRLEGDRIFQ